MASVERAQLTVGTGNGSLPELTSVGPAGVGVGVGEGRGFHISLFFFGWTPAKTSPFR